MECEAHSTHRCHKCIWEEDWKHPYYALRKDSKATNGIRAVKAIQDGDTWILQEYGVLRAPTRTEVPVGFKHPAAINTYIHDFRMCDHCRSKIHRDANGAINIRNHFLWKVAQYLMCQTDQEKEEFQKNWHNPHHRHPAFFIYNPAVYGIIEI